MRKTLVYDLDETLCTKKQPHESYADVKPIQPMIDQLNRFYDEGFEIIIVTARNMVTQKNHVSKVVKNVGLDTLQWLEKHGVKYHGLQFGKEYADAYIDDKAIRPNELMNLVKMNATSSLSQYLKNDINLPIINRSIELIMKKHYVYQWFYFDKNMNKYIFYVGKGSKFRAWDTKGRNETFKKIFNTYDCKVEIVEFFNDKQEAYDYEKELKYKYIDLGQCEACLDDIRGRVSPQKGKPAWNRSENYKSKSRHPLGKKQPKSEMHKMKIKESNIGKHNHNYESNPNSKLTEGKVKNICLMLNNNIHPSEIAKQFNVSEITIHRIKGKKAWVEISNKYLLVKNKTVSEVSSKQLTENDVIKICKLLNENSTITSIAKQFNVSENIIKRINNGSTWKHITEKHLNNKYT